MQEVEKIIQTAIKMEKDGADFYRESAQKVSYSPAKKMFLSLMEDEKRHLEIFKKLMEDLEFSEFEDYFTKSPRQKIKSIFDNLGEEERGKIKVAQDEFEVLEFGIKIEDESVKFYENFLKEAEKENVKRLLERIIKEEKEHSKILQNTYSLLKNSGDWFLWEEKALLNGG